MQCSDRRDFLKTSLAASIGLALPGCASLGLSSTSALKAISPIPNRLGIVHNEKPEGKMFGSQRIYYNNYADHLLNAYNPNMFYTGLPYRWSDDGWKKLIDMIAAFGFNAFEFWLVPRLFCQEGLNSEAGHEFIRQTRVIIDHAHTRSVKVILLAALATVGAEWRTYCPNVPDEWAEIQRLWSVWSGKFPDLDGVSIFPGDPGACSRNGCTAETYIDRSIDIANLLRKKLPRAEIEFGTWGPPFFGWGNIKGPENWRGEFIQEYQQTAWDYDQARTERSMQHLLNRLHDFPENTCVAINLGFNGDGSPEGQANAIHWAKEIAKARPIRTWDFSLTEGENAIFPHYRFARLFSKRRLERDSAPYSGGICFTMTPLLNQLSLYESAQSFLHPDADPNDLARGFFAALFGPEGEAIVEYLPLFEIIPDWGNYNTIDISQSDFHKKMKTFVDCLRALEGKERDDVTFHPGAVEYRRDLLFFAEFFAGLSGPSPVFSDLRQKYWDRVYKIYDKLPQHVDPRPVAATDRLIQHFEKKVGWKS